MSLAKERRAWLDARKSHASRLAWLVIETASMAHEGFITHRESGEGIAEMHTLSEHEIRMLFTAWGF
jgi:hypothetical protein